MPQSALISRLLLSSLALLMAGCTFVIQPEAAQLESTPSVEDAPDASAAARRIITDVELLGVVTIPNGTVAMDTPVGELSAIAYDPVTNAYYILSDDRGMMGPVRIYQAAIDLGDGSLDEGDVQISGLIPLLDATGTPYAQGMIDPEGLVYTGEHFYVSTEGDADAQPPIAPSVIEFTVGGEFVGVLPVPEKFIPQPDGSRGVRDNRGFESLTLTPDGRTLIAGLENGLVQDGPAATLEDESLSRLLKFDLTTGEPGAELIYVVDAIPVAPDPADGDADNGLTDLAALDNAGTVLALERSYAEGVGNTVRLYVAATQGAMDVSSIESLAAAEGAASGANVVADLPVTKELLLDFGELGSELGIAPDNLEALVLGATLPDGRQSLIVVSDNNFNPSQTTQVWALALTIEDAP